MKRQIGKSHCPINFTLELIGDPWSLLILRDIILLKKCRYKDFLSSPEKIATNILADRLAKLESYGIIEKMCESYLVTEKGRDLLPVLIELSAWGSKYDAQTASPKKFADWAKQDIKKYRKEMEKLAE
jgi:DNA-binding HxlR family transcriptional regulator